MINPRGSTGYGQTFVDDVTGDWGGKPYIDLMKGLDYAEQHYPLHRQKPRVRPRRQLRRLHGQLGPQPHQPLQVHRLPRRHVQRRSPPSATTEELWFNEWEFRPLAGNGPDAVVEQTKPAHPWDFYDKPAIEDPFRKWSPMLSIKNSHTPTLVVHSQRDYRLDVSEGFQLFTALQLLGVPSKMLYFPDEGHWILKPQNSQLWYKTVNDWCDRWLGMNKYAANGPEKNPAAAQSHEPRYFPHERAPSALPLCFEDFAAKTLKYWTLDLSPSLSHFSLNTLRKNMGGGEGYHGVPEKIRKGKSSARRNRSCSTTP